MVEGNFGTWSNSWSYLIWDLWEREVQFQSTEVSSVVRYFHCLQHRFKSWNSSLGGNTKVFFLGLKHWVQLQNNHCLYFTCTGKNVPKIHLRHEIGKKVFMLQQEDSCCIRGRILQWCLSISLWQQAEPTGHGCSLDFHRETNLTQGNDNHDVVSTWRCRPQVPPPHPAGALWFVPNTSSSCCCAPNAHPSRLHHQGLKSAYLWTLRTV